MPYKRKVRLLFIGHGDPCRARLAAAIALRLGQAFLEARAMTVAGVQTLDLHEADETDRPDVNETAKLDKAALHWADLVVCLDAQSDALCADLPATAQKRCYPYAAPSDAASLAALSLALERRIKGIIGGIKMLA